MADITTLGDSRSKGVNVRCDPWFGRLSDLVKKKGGGQDKEELFYKTTSQKPLLTMNTLLHPFPQVEYLDRPMQQEQEFHAFQASLDSSQNTFVQNI